LIDAEEPVMCDALSRFLQETRDTREYTRALAVQLALHEVDYAVIIAALEVSRPFISKWKRIYIEHGVDGLRMSYRGSAGFLTPDQRTQTLAWLRAQSSWSVAALQTYLRDPWGVVYQSAQSYYALLHAAGLRWKKAQARNPKKTPPSWQPAAPNGSPTLRPIGTRLPVATGSWSLSMRGSCCGAMHAATSGGNVMNG
jgi:putative transposase